MASVDEPVCNIQTHMRKIRKSQIHIHWQSNTKTLPQTLQSDTGANVSATNDKTILHDYRQLETPIPIQTYQESSTTRCEAEGIGIINEAI